MTLNRRDLDLTDSVSTEMSGSALAQRRSAHLPKLKDFPTDTVFESANEAQVSHFRSCGELFFER